MNKKSNLMKGFNMLLQPAVMPVDQDKNKNIRAEENRNKKIENKATDVSTLKRLDAQTPRRLDASEQQLIVKYKEYKKCTLYIPADVYEALSIMKIKTNKDLSELTADALKEYLTSKHYL